MYSYEHKNECTEFVRFYSWQVTRTRVSIVYSLEDGRKQFNESKSVSFTFFPSIFVPDIPSLKSQTDRQTDRQTDKQMDRHENLAEEPCMHLARANKLAI